MTEGFHLEAGHVIGADLRALGENRREQPRYYHPWGANGVEVERIGRVYHFSCL